MPISEANLEEIHARGFGLTDEIIKSNEHEADARELASSDDDDDDGSLGKDAVMRPPSGEEETLTPILKPAKNKKKKWTSTSKDPKPKKNPVRKPKKDTVALPADVIQQLREEEEDEDDGSELVGRVKETIEAPKAAKSVVVEDIPPRAEGVLEKDSGEVPESSMIEDASQRDEKKAASELAKAKSEAEKAKAEAEVIVAVYRAEAKAAQVQVRVAAETAQTRAHWIAELAKCQSQRETLEVIHARDLDLTDEIIKAKEHKADARALASSDDDDEEGSKSGSENGEDLDGEEDILLPEWILF
ncbi:ATP-dependent RNA helicase drs1-like [Nicotiana tomentosiformis]|uniref:ATP-dependent RNA helicase drs1-like n=1 Tax=Nicotiana tomentosiformis TaxID=4098 RepID=UPI00388C4385